MIDLLPGLKQQLKLDFIVVNGENAAHGFGLTPKICQDFFKAGADVVTLGNHSWDQREILSFIESEPRLLRPCNYPPGTPGKGAGVFEAPQGRKVLVAQAMGRLYMDPLDDPFAGIEAILARQTLGGTVQAALVDIHAEASSEKMAFGHFCDGRVSVVVGSHTHIPTADVQILPKGTAYQSDAGMCGDYDSVIGMGKDVAIARFVRKIPGNRLTPAEGEATFCGLFVETDDKSGLAQRACAVRIGGRLAPSMPE